MDPATGARLLSYSQWLLDRQTGRLSSIESRAGTIVGWGGTQIALTAGALALLQQIGHDGLRQAGAVLLAVGGAVAAVAVGISVLGVLRVRHGTPAPETDLSELIVWATAAHGDTVEALTIERLIGAINEPGEDEDGNVLAPVLQRSLRTWIGAGGTYVTRHGASGLRSCATALPW